ncbi:histone-lysine N-methyltransferase, H3 lysine-9 specific SUVH4-like [Hibiscus syriacus]|uniref:histone-lysine N-methyltransferase, H3 lysine-9 specific SUVH4-like n=1 Tax=Hibiscus syriacus TaxID=106335 RepID=UPI001920757B|nr:histone-lysine N-methyltransferase, H3 lysine-9 specific SUVH4-like [Hibiscus syriacus]
MVSIVLLLLPGATRNVNSYNSTFLLKDFLHCSPSYPVTQIVDKHRPHLRHWWLRNKFLILFLGSISWATSILSFIVWLCLVHFVHGEVPEVNRELRGLKQLQGQDNLTSWNQVRFVHEEVSRVNRELRGLVCKDISNGQEDKCIPVFNLYNPTVAPTGFKYIKSIQFAKNVSIPPDAPGCKCRGKCTNPESCSCAKLNGGDFPYVSRDGGRLFEAKDVVFECGPNCGCGPECVNRASQKGLKYHLEVYQTKDKGWAVRTLDFIPSGAPVCEYVGILRKNDELEDISENDYIFEIDCWHTMKGIGGRERRLGDVSLPMSNFVDEDEESLESDPEPEFCIDASSCGNATRFINHSCDPNLFVQCVLSSHHDVRLARIVLFAADNIPRMQELTYDYNYAIDSVVGPDGKTKQLPCFCGTDECRKRLY